LARKKQWHPVFAELLRPLVESHYEIQTEVPVGDAPRKADFVLLRRTRAGQLPAGGLWRDLTAWSVLEYKGPTVSPRDEDLDALVELGLGIRRRLIEERASAGHPTLAPSEVSLWYLAHRLGRRLLRGWRGRMPGLREHGPGVWRWDVLGHPVFLVSGRELPVEEASLPLHLISRESSASERAAARLVAGRGELWDRYSAWLASLHPALFEEVIDMAKRTREKPYPDLAPIVKMMGLDWVVEHLGAQKVLQVLGPKRYVEEAGGAEKFLSGLSPEQREEFKRLLRD
jgi:hypothetical protein